MTANAKQSRTDPLEFCVQDEAGDFAAVLFTVMQGRSYAASDISCAEINQRLDDIVR
jgi:hypothetical protein